MNIVIFGAPGSGKGTQSEKLISEYGLHHISTGELLRDHIARGTHLGKVADTYISQGLLIPDELMVEVLADLFKENPVQHLSCRLGTHDKCHDTGNYLADQMCRRLCLHNRQHLYTEHGRKYHYQHTCSGKNEIL